MIVKTLLILFLTFGTAIASFADQFQINDFKTCQDAVNIIKRKPYLVSYCSQCDQQSVQVWKVKDALITTDDGENFSVTIIGRRVYESSELFDRGKYREPIKFTFSKAPNPDDLWFTEEIDLAYIYIPLGSRSFDNLAKFIGLKPNIQVNTIKLPMDIST